MSSSIEWCNRKKWSQLLKIDHVSVIFADQNLFILFSDIFCKVEQSSKEKTERKSRTNCRSKSKIIIAIMWKKNTFSNLSILKRLTENDLDDTDREFRLKEK